MYITNYYYTIQITSHFGLIVEAGGNAGRRSESVTDSILRKRVGLKQKNKIKAEGKAEHEGRKEIDSEFNNYLEPTGAQTLNP